MNYMHISFDKFAPLNLRSLIRHQEYVFVPSMVDIIIIVEVIIYLYMK